jgi:anaerobic selenocysteine-containing dehydrogenase
MSEKRYRICPFCEATCGLEIEVDGDRVEAVRGDDDDVFSNGFICPKGPAIAELHADPDRLRQPLVKRDGRHVPVSWDDAFTEIERGLGAVIAAHGRESVGVYLGNPSVHNWTLGLYSRVFLRALQTPHIYSASTVDQIPKQLASGLMFGSYTTVAVPDIDRTDFLLILGANPFESNGSLWTVPDFPGRLRKLQSRGGRCVVVDPKRTRTAAAADRHLFIRPGTDALLLAAIAQTLFAENLVDLGALAPHATGLDETRAAVAPFTPEAVADTCAVAADDIRQLARDLAAAPRAAVYGRIGTCTQEFGTLASWLVDVCNVLTGNLDRPGGVLFPLAPAFGQSGKPGVGRGIATGRRRTRVRGAPEVMGEFPCACIAEEIETPGAGQMRALVTIAGNPVLSTPNGARLDAALRQLDFMVSLDIYLNETSRHADVVLPGLSPLENSHYDIAFPGFAYRNAVRYSPPVLAPPADQPAEWQTLLRLTAIVSPDATGASVDDLDDFVFATNLQRALGPSGAIDGKGESEIRAELAGRRGPERLLDLALRMGPYGDGFGRRPDGVSLAKVEAAPHGIDLGELQSRIPEVLRTPSGKIDLAPEPLLGDVARLQGRIARDVESMFLIGRRHLRSNNSWMHNLPRLTRGRHLFTLQIHSSDAARLALRDGATALVSSRAGRVEVPVEVTDDIMPGVVSMPHGWGHDREGAMLSVARERPGANTNILADESALDPLSGNAVLNGIPVTVSAA